MRTPLNGPAAREPAIRFHITRGSGLPAYRQLVDQVRQALSLGLLAAGDRLPSVREVVAEVTINPNTVHRAYQVLEADGVVEARAGLGTFVTSVAPPSATPEHQMELQEDLRSWAERARRSGMSAEAISALIAVTFPNPAHQRQSSE